MPRGRTANAQVTTLVNKVKAMVIGHSFFVEGVDREDMEFLRRPLVKLGVGVSIRRIERDEIYQAAGVRVWREEGEYDEL